VVVPDRLANVRKDANGKDVYLGTVSTSYRIIQNTESFTFFDSVVGQKLAMYHTAGALKAGRKVWILAKLPGELVVGSKDVTEKYLLLSNSHDGSSTLRMFFTPVRVVCQNTLNLALNRAGEKEGISIHHSGKVDDKVAEAVRVLKIANKKYEELERIFNAFQERTLATSDVTDYFKKVLPDEQETNNAAKERMRGEMMSNYKHGAGADMSFGSLWGAYNAVTEYFDHTRYAGKKTAVNVEGRMESIMFGGAYATKQKAFDLAYEAVAGAL